MTKKMVCVAMMGGLFTMVLLSQSATVYAYTLEELVKLSSQIQNERPGINLELAGNKADYQVGENVGFEFKADKDCYLVLIDIGTSGRAIILFPNKWHPDNKIEKDKTYMIPPKGSKIAYKVQGPTGMERIKAIASVDPVLSKVESLQEELRVPLPPQTGGGGAQELSQGQVFLAMKDPGVVLKDIGIVFSKLDLSKWATAELTFKIADARLTPSAGQAQPQAPAATPAPTAPPEK